MNDLKTYEIKHNILDKLGCDYRELHIHDEFRTAKEWSEYHNETLLMLKNGLLSR